MGGRGSFAKGHVPERLAYKTVREIEGVPVVVGTGDQHSLPVEARRSRAYMRLRPDGSFHSIRFYGEDHYATKDIAYHREPDLAPGGPILHIHEYKRDNFTDRKPRLLTEEEYNLYKKYFKGELRWRA